MQILAKAPARFKLQMPVQLVCPDGRIVTLEACSVGPDEAEAMMKMNTRNRKVTPKNVTKLAAAIDAGDWMFNGETVIFDEDGCMIQGQHRCLAVIKTGKSIDVLIVRGVSREAFKTLDGGRKRLAPDALGIDGESNVNVLASALRVINHIEGAPVNDGLTPSQAKRILQAHPSTRFWVSLFTGPAKKFMPSAFVGVLTIAAERYGHDAIKRFFDQVVTGEGLKASDPAYLLRERFRDRARSDVLPYSHSTAYCIKAVNAYTQGAPIKILRLTANESMPVLL